MTAPERMCAPTSEPFSTTTTPISGDICLSRIAAASPAGPAPTITTSNSIASRAGSSCVLIGGTASVRDESQTSLVFHELPAMTIALVPHRDALSGGRGCTAKALGPLVGVVPRREADRASATEGQDERLIAERRVLLEEIDWRHARLVFVREPLVDELAASRQRVFR